MSIMQRPWVRRLAAGRDPHVVLWRALGWVLAIWALWQGAAYAYGGNSQVHSPSLYVLSHDVPGGMRTHGFIMLCLSAVFLYTLRSGNRLTRWILEVFCGYCFLVAFTVFGSWYITKQVVFAAPTFWLAFGAISGVMIMFPPPGYRER